MNSLLETIFKQAKVHVFTHITIPGQSGPGSNGNEGILHITQSTRIEALPSNGLVLYPGHLFGVSYSSAEMQSAYSTAPPSPHWLESEYSIT